jgi:thiamine monophosphate synthase
VRRGALSVERAAAVIAEARERVAEVRAFAARKRPPAELESAQSNLKAWLANWFLTGPQR